MLGSSVKPEDRQCGHDYNHGAECPDCWEMTLTRLEEIAKRCEYHGMEEVGLVDTPDGGAKMTYQRAPMTEEQRHEMAGFWAHANPSILVSMFKERSVLKRPPLRHVDDWHDEDGPVLWWHLEDGEIGEPPWVGSPNDVDWIEYDGYYTHWTPIPQPRY